MRQRLGTRLHNKSKSNNYPELIDVDVADIWRERLHSYLGRSHGHNQCNKTFAVMVETRFVMRSQQKP
jgi:hypothetical protein